MLKKNYSKTGEICRATFKLPAEVDAEEVLLLGEFNDWSIENGKKMKRLKDGSFSTTISLESNNEYRFRYLLDKKRWENDWAADEYRPNIYGTDDSIIRI